MRGLSKSFYLLIGLLFLNHLPGLTQDLSKHRWKERIVFLISNELGEDSLVQQLAQLKLDPEGLKERRIIVYRKTDDNVLSGIGEKTERVETAVDLAPMFLSKGYKPFTFYLIGLDGGVKMVYDRVISIDELFAVIDGMPMRKIEMRKKG